MTQRLMKYQTPRDAFEIMKKDISGIIRKPEKFLMAGYNSKGFDMPFMEAWIKKVTNNQIKFYEYFMYSPFIDVLPLVIAMYYRVAMRNPQKLPKVKNMKLASAVDFAKELVPTYFENMEEKEDKFHDALFDVEQTRDVFKSLLGV